MPRRRGDSTRVPSPSRSGSAEGLTRWLASPWAILGLGSALRAVLFARMYEPPDIWLGDPLTYTEIQEGLRRFELIPDAWIWPPGYPLLALPLSLLVGTGLALAIVSFVAGTALPAVPLIAGKLTGMRFRGKLAALVIAVHPEAVLASARPASECPGVLLTMGTVLALEIAGHTGRGKWAVAAGVFGGFAALTRPELILCIVLLGLFALLGRRPLRIVAIFGATAAVLVLPYVVALHSASGHWALSLKLPYNVEKSTVYQQGSDFVDKRLRWEAFLEENVLDEDGEIDPRRLAEVARVRRWVLHPEMPGFWAGNVVEGFVRDPWMVNVLWIAGIAGLALPGRRGRREAALAAISATPLLAVPVLFTPVERYALVALPAFAWGAATTVERLRERLPSNSLRGALVAIVAAAAITGGIVGSFQGARNSHWIGRSGEFHVAMGRRDFATAERLVLDALRVDPENPEIHEALAGLRFQQGNLPAAERALLDAGRYGADPAKTAAGLERVRSLMR